MTHRYDWSKLDAGWEYFDGILTETYVDDSKGAADLGGLWARRQWGVTALELTRSDDVNAEARAQLAKCRIRDTEPAPPSSKFPAPTGDNTALFEAMDKMAAEILAEEWAKAPSYPKGLRCKSCGAARPHKCPGIVAWQPLPSDPPKPNGGLIATPMPTGVFELTGGTLTPNAREYVAMPGIPPEWMEPQPSQPWRRGPLAAWKLVNISCHDGRLTVIMKRGRGELIDETGPDDETLWERLSAKVVEFEKAKAE